MSKYVKDLMTRDIAKRIDGVSDCLLVSVIGLDSNSTVNLRRDLRGKGINLLVVKNSLARRACEGTSLAPAFDGVKGTTAIVWGAEDFVSLAKEITKLADDDTLKSFETRGGVLDGEALTPDKVKEISKWPSRVEQLSIVAGQILSVGANLSGALLGPGGLLASQLKEKAGGESEEAAGEDAPGEEAAGEEAASEEAAGEEAAGETASGESAPAEAPTE
ncbi:MAG: 50S ribosomal protein L10 [Planctomycetes bacterium]|nr:50S ribosomal protein L10 [Planctomycetota bacterium]